jgi:hypothetical protein
MQFHLLYFISLLLFHLILRKRGSGFLDRQKQFVSDPILCEVFLLVSGRSQVNTLASHTYTAQQNRPAMPSLF